MNKFCLELILTLSLLMSGSVLFGQEEIKNTKPEDRAKYQTEWMKKELKLDNLQEQKAYSINLKYAQKNQSIINSADSKMQKYKAFKSSQEAKDKELKSVFSENQYTTYKQKKEELKDKMREKFKDQKGGDN